MLHALLFPLAEHFSVLNVFRYTTFRAFGAAFTAIILCLMFGRPYIDWLRRKQIGQSIRELGPESHQSKKGTPTMGGGLILSAIGISTLLWMNFQNDLVWVALFVLAGFGCVGWIDDYQKVVQKNSKGISARQKLFWQTLIAFAAATYLYLSRDTPPVLHFPFLKEVRIDLGLLFIPFATLVIVGASNAVNLTDGLDGLAVGPTITTALTLAVFAYVAGTITVAEYLNIPHVNGAAEMAVFLSALGAACLGFLWFNSYPAEVFMGDVGALSLGGALGVAAVMTKNELLLVICGGVFVAEAVSVMMQVSSFKMTGRRIFRMAPLHHHFELKGWPEPKVIVRFWIVSILLALVSLASLKLR